MNVKVALKVLLPTHMTLDIFQKIVHARIKNWIYQKMFGNPILHLFFLKKEKENGNFSTNEYAGNGLHIQRLRVVLFANFVYFSAQGKQLLGQLCNVKFDNWKKAVERFSEHEKCLYHKKSIETAGTLNDILLGKMKPVDE